MDQILIVDYNSPDLGKIFSTSLKNTGFAIVKNHPISQNLIHSIYHDWEVFFNSKHKHDYLFHKVKQDGYFPYLSENAKGSTTKDLKEFYHIYNWGRYPTQISDKTNIPYAPKARKVIEKVKEEDVRRRGEEGHQKRRRRGGDEEEEQSWPLPVPTRVTS